MGKILITASALLLTLYAGAQQRTFAENENIKLHDLKIVVQAEDSEVPNFIFALIECQEEFAPQYIAVGSSIHLHGQIYSQLPLQGDSSVFQFMLNKLNHTDYNASKGNLVGTIILNDQKLHIGKRPLPQTLSEEELKNLDPSRKTWIIQDFIPRIEEQHMSEYDLTAYLDDLFR